MVVVSTYDAPVAKTPVLRENISAVIISVRYESAITLEGKLYMMIDQERAFSRERTCGALLSQAPDDAPDRGQEALDYLGRLSPIHRSRAVKDFLASGAACRIQLLEQLPGYAPDLNPDEGVCKHLKCVE